MNPKHIDDRSSTINTVRGNIEHLAPEILFQVLMQIHDLESLDNLLRVSPAASRLFDLRGVEIFESVLSSDPNIHKYTRALIRIIVLLRATALPLYVCDLTSFKYMLTQDTTAHRYEPARWEYETLELPGHTSIKALREVLGTNGRIQRLGVDCLRYYLEIFKELKPMHLVDKEYRYPPTSKPIQVNQGLTQLEVLQDYVDRINSNQSFHPVDRIKEQIYKEGWRYEEGPWLLTPETMEADIQDIGAPSWIEQQRVLRTLWQIRLWHELKDAIGTSCITWPEKDISAIWQMKLEDLYDVPTRLPDDQWKAQLLADSDEARDIGRDGELVIELLRTVVAFLSESREPIKETTYLQLKGDWASSPLVEDPEEWYPEDMDKPHQSIMYWFYTRMSGQPDKILGGEHLADPGHPLQHVEFGPFRKLGFAIWCRDRLCGYGFMPSGQDAKARFEIRSSCHTAWRSVMTEEERRKLIEVNERWEEEEKESIENALVYGSEEYKEWERRNEEARVARQLADDEDEYVYRPPLFGLENNYWFRKKGVVLRMKDEADDGQQTENLDEEEENTRT